MLKKKVMFNVGNIIKGGAVQAAVNFIVENKALNDEKFQWYFILSTEVNQELINLGIHLIDNTLVLQGRSTKNKAATQAILLFEKKHNPIIVFTLFGPCYINFKAFHITGFANGWVTHSTLRVFANTYRFSIIKMLKAMLKYCYYAFHIRTANAWVFETHTAKKGFINRLKVNKKHCFVVPNTCIDLDKGIVKTDKVIINQHTLHYTDKLIIALAADYPHKNLLSLINTAYYLKNDLHQENFKIVFTLDEKVFNDVFMPLIIQYNLQQQISNIGKVNIADLPKLYSVAFASILPSFIETFSAVYPESFSTGTPVITSDAGFAHEICQDAALYVDPNNKVSMAKGVHILLTNNEKYKSLVNYGQHQFKEMLSPQQKYQAYIDVLSHYASQIKVD